MNSSDSLSHRPEPLVDQIATIIQAGHRDQLTSFDVAEAVVASLPGAVPAAGVPPDLFVMPEVLSPRLQWMGKHGLATRCAVNLAEVKIGEEWRAWSKAELAHALENHSSFRVGLGTTENDALADLAQLLGVKLWNEEQA